ncbi:hypothetical protein Tco_1024857, partial [Tanacetum coccineum]
MRIEPTVPQKEETFQVVLHIIKASPCFKDFTITVDVPEIYMQQFWFTIKKTKKTPFYEFGLADKKFSVDIELFRKILDICPRVPNEDFVAPPSEEDLLAFLNELGYKGPLDHLARMFVDHMHQPWRTLATIINKILSGKASSNDRLRQSRVLWGMFYMKNVDYLELIWEDLTYQIDYRQEKLRRWEIILYPRFTKIIINHFLSLNPSIPKGPSSGLHTIKNDGVISTLKFFRIGLIPPKKSRDVAFKLGKSMRLIEAEEEEASRQVHATHERLVTESDPKMLEDQLEEDHLVLPLEILQVRKSSRSQSHARGSSEGTGIIPGVPDEPTVIFTTSSEGTGIIPGVPDEPTVIFTTSSEGTGITPGVPDEVKVTSEAKADSTIDWGSENESDYSEEENIDEEEKRLIGYILMRSKRRKIMLMIIEALILKRLMMMNKTDDEFVHGDEYVHDKDDEDMKEDEVAKTGKDDDDKTDAAKADVEKMEEVKGDHKKAELPLTRSSLSVSFGFGNQFLTLSFDISLTGTLKDTADVEINSLLDVQIQQEIPHIQSPSMLTVTVSMILEPTVLSLIPEIPTVTPVTILLPPPLSPLSHLVSIFEKDVKELKQVDHSPAILAKIRSKVPAVVDEYLGSSLGDALQNVLQKHTEELIQQSSQKDIFEIIKMKQEQADKKKMPKFSTTPYDQAAEDEFKQKEILLKMMRESKSYEKQPK